MSPVLIGDGRPAADVAPAAPATMLQLIRASASTRLPVAVGPISSSAELTRNVMRAATPATTAPLLRIASRAAVQQGTPIRLNARQSAVG